MHLMQEVRSSAVEEQANDSCDNLENQDPNVAGSFQSHAEQVSKEVPKGKARSKALGRRDALATAVHPSPPPLSFYIFLDGHLENQETSPGNWYL